jgi:O-antigen/teichoic acid export membrane protein
MLSRLLAVLKSRRGAALLDQGLISGSNFLILLYGARLVPAEQWGEFGFAYATVLFGQGFQRAMVTIPMITFSAQLQQWAIHEASWAALNIRLAFSACLLALGVAAASTFLGFVWAANSALMAAMLSIPLFCMEFGRRAAIQGEKYSTLVLSACSYAIGAWLTVAAMQACGSANRWLPVAAVVGGAMLSYAVAVGGRISRMIGNLERGTYGKEYLEFGLWASLGHLGFSGYNFGMQALLGAIAGPAALGAFHACRTLLQPINTLVGAMDSIDKPRAANAYASEGRSGLFGILGRSATVIGVFAGAYIAAALSVNDWLLAMAYGEKYIDQGNVLAMWCLVAGVTALAQPIESGLYVIRRTRELFYSRLMASIVSIACGVLLIDAYGAIGALLATAVGYALATARGIQLLHSQTE